jgi:hypothetical protein
MECYELNLDLFFPNIISVHVIALINGKFNPILENTHKLPASSNTPCTVKEDYIK